MKLYEEDGLVTKHMGVSSNWRSTKRQPRAKDRLRRIGYVGCLDLSPSSPAQMYLTIVCTGPDHTFVRLSG